MALLFHALIQTAILRVGPLGRRHTRHKCFYGGGFASRVVKRPGDGPDTHPVPMGPANPSRVVQREYPPVPSRLASRSGHQVLGRLRWV